MAYVFYTSGSTGKPKGVVIEQRCVQHYVAAAQALYPSEAVDCCLMCANYTFDVSVHSLWTAWSNGASLCLLPKEALLERGSELVAAHGVTTVALTTSQMGMFRPRVVAASLRRAIQYEAPTPPLPHWVLP